MLKSPISSLISLAKRKAQTRSEKKLPPLRFIKENEDIEQGTQTTDYPIKSAVKEENTKQGANVIESSKDLDESAIKLTVDPKMAEESKPNPGRKLETIEVSHNNLY